MRLKLFLATALLLAVTIQHGRAYVYRFTDDGVRHHWASMPVNYSINSYGSDDISDFSDVKNAFIDCFQAWAQVSMAEISFTYQDPIALAPIGYDGTNLLAFDSHTIKTDGTSFIVSVDAGPATIGIALSWTSTTGEYLDCDIVFNDAAYTFITEGETDLSNNLVNLLDVATHEIGHLVGLNHTFQETATMWPTAKQGLRYLSEDDIAGARSLYPSQEFAQQTESFSGTVTDEQGDPLWGIFISTIHQDTQEESVGVITGADGQYLIEGLAQETGYYLKARSVDLDHLGSYMEQGTYVDFIPQYFSNTTRLQDAQVLVSGTDSQGLDFQLKQATTLARYDSDMQNLTVLSSPYSNVTAHYLAVRFPASSLPENFQVFSMTFYNNDGNMAWPRIILTTGSGEQPDLGNILSLEENYIGKELGLSTVEWEAYNASNARDLWVVFQMPSKAFVMQGDGPGIIAEGGNNPHGDFFWSSDEGNTFQPYPSTQYDVVLYLTVGLLEGPVLEPLIQLAIEELDFGIAKVEAASQLPWPVTNLGNAPLELSGIISSKQNSFGISATEMTIPAGATDTLQVSFTPLDAIQYTGIISMATNDPAMGAVNLPVKGTGAYPVAAVGAQSIDFGEVEVGQTLLEEIVVRNAGAVSLLVSQVAASPDPFSAQPAEVEIAAGDSSILEVAFAPSEEGSFTGSLTFTTDDPDPDHAQIVIGLTGVGKSEELQVVCDFNGDGSIEITDVITLLLFQRANPGDLRGDFNGNGSSNITDAIAMLLAMRNETCPDASSALLSGSDTSQDESFYKKISAEEIAYLERIIPLLELTPEEEAAMRLALYGPERTPSLPEAFSLSQNYPNPFNPVTVIGFTVPQGMTAEHVSLRVYDIRGALVRVLVDGIKEPGSHAVYWDGTDKTGRRVSSGIYLYRLKAGGAAFTRKMVVLN